MQDDILELQAISMHCEGSVHIDSQELSWSDAVQKEFKIVVPIEPINLKEWKLAAGFHPGGRLFTCGRPGRAVFGRKRVHVDDGTIDRWVDGLTEDRGWAYRLVARLQE